MMFLALTTALVVYFAAHIVALVALPNVRRLWAALARLALCGGALALPWIAAWQYSERLSRWLLPRFEHLNLVISLLITAALSWLLWKLACRLNLKPRWIPDPKDDTNPVVAVALLPFAPALASYLSVIIGYAAVTWLLTEHSYRYLRVVVPLSRWVVGAP